MLQDHIKMLIKSTAVQLTSYGTNNTHNTFGSITVSALKQSVWQSRGLNMKDYEKAVVVKCVAPPAIWVPLLFIAICAAGAN